MWLWLSAVWGGLIISKLPKRISFTRLRSSPGGQTGNNRAEFVCADVPSEQLAEGVCSLFLRARGLTFRLCADYWIEVISSLYWREVLGHERPTNELLLFQNNRTVDEVRLFRDIRNHRHEVSKRISVRDGVECVGLRSKNFHFTTLSFRHQLFLNLGDFLFLYRNLSL